MPLPKHLLDEMSLRRAAAEEEADRLRNRDLVRSGLACIGWCALGLFLIMWSAHTTDLLYGRMAFFAGLGIGNGGIIFTLLAAWRRGERRGDW
jgi:hypothetical protein